MPADARVLLATSVGPGKEYAIPLLRSVLPRLTSVAGCLVTFDGIAPETVLGGAGTHQWLAAPPEDLCLFGRVARMRESQRRYFLASASFTHLYWHDADMIPPDDIVERLLAADVPVASGIYNVRGVEGLLLPLLAKRPDKRGKVTARYGEVAELPCEGSVVRPWAVGMGCLLVRRDVLERTAFRAPETYAEGGMGEDVRWCLDGGIRPLVDLSLPCWHVDADGNGTRPQAHGMDGIGSLEA